MLPPCPKLKIEGPLLLPNREDPTWLLENREELAWLLEKREEPVWLFEVPWEVALKPLPVNKLGPSRLILGYSVLVFRSPCLAAEKIPTLLKSPTPALLFWNRLAKSGLGAYLAVCSFSSSGLTSFLGWGSSPSLLTCTMLYRKRFTFWVMG